MALIRKKHRIAMRKRMTRPPLSFYCEYCGSRIGKQCIRAGRTNMRLNQFHKARIKAAQFHDAKKRLG